MITWGKIGTGEADASTVAHSRLEVELRVGGDIISEHDAIANHQPTIGVALPSSFQQPYYAGHNLVLIIGCPRSGTTWLQRLLAGHPRLRTGQESNLFHYVAPQLREWRYSLKYPSHRGGVGLACYFTEEEFLANLKAYLAVLLAPLVATLREDELFLEKTPSHGLYLPEIVELLPEVRIIHIYRDPRDVAASMLAASRSWGTSWAPRTAQAAARTWVRHVNAAHEASQFLPSSQFLELSYEALQQDTQRELKRCADFLDVEWTDEAILETIQQNSFQRTAGMKEDILITVGGEVARTWGKSTSTVPDGFVRRAQVGSWQTELSLHEKIWVWRIARTLMSERGYHWSSPYTGLHWVAAKKHHAQKHLVASSKTVLKYLTLRTQGERDRFRR